METLDFIVRITSAITTIIAALMLFIKPIREKILGMGKMLDGQKCLLRSEMLQIYYKHRDTKVIRQYEYENFVYMYQAYKELKGNSFIDKIKKEVDEWEIIS